MITKLNIKLLLIFIIALQLMSCRPTSESLTKEINTLTNKRDILSRDIINNKDVLQSIKNEISDIKIERSRVRGHLKELQLLGDGKVSIYILKLRIKQSTLSFDLDDLMKDAETLDFEIPVNRDFYYSINNGDDLKNSIKIGSLVLNSTFRSWSAKVLNKRIEYEDIK